ncbi:MAG: AAA family ATPase [Candidatus Undinarchaeales archaeon]|jgi:hypothetical protein|nr:AAA family ATPase [Candidatus Undinarchaeales archaeon]MDP7492997.1 AAA family ATPase [Candidatus Undinarchaeales archaeon]
MIIVRGEAEEIKKIHKWLLVYGRRKTGKTFLLRNLTDYDEYYFVKRDRGILTDSGALSYETFLELFKRQLNDGGTVIVDEFHRLGEGFQDILHFLPKKGKVILVSSTLHLSRKLVGSHSPLLGVVAEFQMPLLRLFDVLSSLHGDGLSKKELVETAVLLREPITIDHYTPGEGAVSTFTRVMTSTKYLVPALIGEIFTEEDRSLSAVYEGVLRAIAGGKCVSSEISSFLFSHGLIKKDDPSLLQQYLNNLVSFGLLKRLKVYNKRRYVYMHTSPLVYLYFYADEKYNLSEIEAGPEVISRIIAELYPRIIEGAVRELLAEHFGLVESVVREKDFDIDAYLLRFKTPEVAVEVKWKDKVSSKDVRKAEDTLSRVEAKRRILFVPDKKKVECGSDLEIMDVGDVLQGRASAE